MLKPLDILSSYWGYESFRPLQEEIIQSVIEGKDTLALLPTGGGKSICFQVPGLVLGGMTLVISPLIALMQDQVQRLNESGIAATFINSSLSFRDIDRKLQMAVDGKFRFVYLAPERLKTEIFLTRLPQMDVRLIAVDEAHCISQWGYDFRPSYLQINELRERLPSVPLIALTATATEPVVKDIRTHLEMENGNIFRKSFRRPNLSFKVADIEDVPTGIARYLKKQTGSAIVYARTRKKTVAMAEFLQREDIPAQAYHGGMTPKERQQAQARWLSNEIQVMVATNAFGMGIDKPDVRTVLHLNLPADLESYYQEAGRAGRDGNPATAVAFQDETDLEELEAWVNTKYPTWPQLVGHYQVLCNHFGIPNTTPPERVFPLNLGSIAQMFQVQPIRFYSSVKLLDREGLISLNEQPDDSARVKIQVPPRDLLGYKKRFPEHAWILDLLLRQLGGELFSETMRFIPSILARTSKVEEEDLLEGLKALNTRGVVRFIAPMGQPGVRFWLPRHTLTKREVNWEKYTFLSEQAKERFKAVEAYTVSPAEACRSRQLEEYFGEVSTSNCGKCDYCITQLDPQFAINAAVEELRQLLAGGPMHYWDLLGAMKKGSDAEKRELLRSLLDKGKLNLGAHRMVKWKG
ncbi:UNVERIFIED_CONTAM: hypothetical protein GTU68_057434 [Idotea baltica]|nr:hypothetical protein [Idotea baltica]